MSVPIECPVRFGTNGNAAPLLGYGWFGPELGDQWSINERNLLTIDVPDYSDEYWLETDVKPFINPPLLPRQRLDVMIGGDLVRSFDPLSTGDVGCLVPGHLMAGRRELELVFLHLDVASPMRISGDCEDRRPSIAFSRLALMCIPVRVMS